MIKKQYLFLGLLFTLTMQVQSNILAMLPEKKKLSSDSKQEVTIAVYDCVNGQLSVILAEASEDKKNGRAIIEKVQALRDYLHSLNLNAEVYEELVQYVIASLRDMQEKFLEKQNNRLTVIKYFKTTIKSLNEKLKHNKNRNNNNNNINNNNNASTNASKLPVLSNFVPQAQQLTQTNFVPCNNSSDILMSSENTENPKRRKLGSCLSEANDIVQSHKNTNNFTQPQNVCFNLNFDVNQSPLSKKLWGNLAEHKKQEIRNKMYRYRTRLEISGNDELLEHISIDEKMPMTPLIAAIMLLEADDICMLINAGVDCQMPAKNGEMPIALATGCFMNWSQDLERVFLRLFQKTQMNQLIAEQIIKKILIGWRCVGDSYLNPRNLKTIPLHASRTIFLFVLEQMRRHNIQFKNTDLIYAAIETNEPACLEYILERFDQSVDICKVVRKVGNTQKQLFFECIDLDVSFCMMKPLIKSGKFNRAYSNDLIDRILKNLSKLKSATFPETLYEIIDALIVKEEVNKPYQNGDTLFHKMILNIKNLSECFKGSDKHYWDDFFHKLIDFGANPSVKNKLGETPLHKLLIISPSIEKKFKEDSDFRVRFAPIVQMLCEKTDDRLTDAFNNSAKAVKAALLNRLSTILKD